MFAYLKAKLFGIGVLNSEVPGHKGPCYPVWLNENLFLRVEGPSVSGFFKLMSGGEEFHGVVWPEDEIVWSSMGVYGTFRGPDHTMTSILCETCHDNFDNLECPECHGEGRTIMTVRERSQLTPNE